MDEDAHRARLARHRQRQRNARAWAAEVAKQQVEPPVKFRDVGSAYEVTDAENGVVLGRVKKIESYSRQAGSATFWRVIAPGQRESDSELPFRSTRREAAWLLVPEAER